VFIAIIFRGLAIPVFCKSRKVFSSSGVDTTTEYGITNSGNIVFAFGGTLI
jgi:hypothetical protein